jgi:hypothetical protein
MLLKKQYAMVNVYIKYPLTRHSLCMIFTVVRLATRLIEMQFVLIVLKRAMLDMMSNSLGMTGM